MQLLKRMLTLHKRSDFVKTHFLLKKPSVVYSSASYPFLKLKNSFNDACFTNTDGFFSILFLSQNVDIENLGNFVSTKYHFILLRENYTNFILFFICNYCEYLKHTLYDLLQNAKICKLLREFLYFDTTLAARD